MKFLRFASLPSTQDHALELARAGTAPEWTVVAADSQTNGRGTDGKAWYSPPGENLYFSLLLRPPRTLPGLAVINHAAALAVADTLSGHGIAAKIRWPNDVLAGGRKICGILSSSGVDGSGARFAVCGIGLNANTLQFPPELSGTATSLRLETGRPVDREQLLLGTAAALEKRLRFLFERGFGDAVDDYVALMAQLGDAYTDEKTGARGKIVGVDRKGMLLVRYNAEE